jgi:hypothetical protein
MRKCGKIFRAGQSTDDIRHTRFARRITKATNNHSEYVTRIACPRQRWLREHTQYYANTYVTHLVGHPYNARNSLTSWRSVSIWGRTPLHAVSCNVNTKDKYSKNVRTVAVAHYMGLPPSLVPGGWESGARISDTREFILCSSDCASW